MSIARGRLFQQLGVGAQDFGKMLRDLERQDVDDQRYDRERGFYENLATNQEGRAQAGFEHGVEQDEWNRGFQESGRAREDLTSGITAGEDGRLAFDPSKTGDAQLTKYERDQGWHIPYESPSETRLRDAQTKYYEAGADERAAPPEGRPNPDSPLSYGSFEEFYGATAPGWLKPNAYGISPNEENVRAQLLEIYRRAGAGRSAPGPRTAGSGISLDEYLGGF